MTTVPAIATVTASKAKTRTATRLEYLAGSTANLGDRAMLDAARRLFPERILVRLPDGRLPHWLRRAGVGRPAVALLGGGTLINDAWLGLAAGLHRQGTRLVTLGTGVGSWGLGQSDEMDLSGWVAVLRDCREIGVRGPISVKRLRDLGLAQATVAGDPALFYAEPTLPEKGPDAVFALSAVDWPREPELARSGWPAALARDAAHLVHQGWTMKSIAMDSVDIPHLQTIHRWMGDAGARASIRQPQSTEELLAELRPCRFTVGMRLHLAVLGACLGAVPVMIGYRDKHLDFMQSVELPHWHFPALGRPASALSELVRQAAATGPAGAELVRRQAWNARTNLLAYVDRLGASLAHA